VVEISKPILNYYSIIFIEGMSNKTQSLYSLGADVIDPFKTRYQVSESLCTSVNKTRCCYTVRNDTAALSYSCRLQSNMIGCTLSVGKKVLKLLVSLFVTQTLFKL
jgi:hypothetical protein